MTTRKFFTGQINYFLLLFCIKYFFGGYMTAIQLFILTIKHKRRKKCEMDIIYNYLAYCNISQNKTKCKAFKKIIHEE